MIFSIFSVCYQIDVCLSNVHPQAVVVSYFCSFVFVSVCLFVCFVCFSFVWLLMFLDTIHSCVHRCIIFI